MRSTLLFLAVFLPACTLTEPNPETGRSPVSEGVTVFADKTARDPSPYGILEALIAGAAAVGAGYIAKRKYEDRKRKRAGTAPPTGAGTLPGQ